MKHMNDVRADYLFDEEVEQVLNAAEAYAGRQGSHLTRPEHLLMALVRHPEMIGCRILAEHDITPDDVKHEMEVWATRHPTTARSAKTIRFVPVVNHVSALRTRLTVPEGICDKLEKVLDRAADELKDKYANPCRPMWVGDLILGLTLVWEGPAFELLFDSGITHTVARHHANLKMSV